MSKQIPGSKSLGDSVVHTNSQGEQVSIEPRTLDGQRVTCLVIWDDPPPRGSGRPAPMLLDEGTRQWLLNQLAEPTLRDLKRCGCGVLTEHESGVCSRCTMERSHSSFRSALAAGGLT